MPDPSIKDALNCYSRPGLYHFIEKHWPDFRLIEKPKPFKKSRLSKRKYNSDADPVHDRIRQIKEHREYAEERMRGSPLFNFVKDNGGMWSDFQKVPEADRRNYRIEESAA